MPVVFYHSVIHGLGFFVCQWNSVIVFEFHGEGQIKVDILIAEPRGRLYQEKEL